MPDNKNDEFSLLRAAAIGAPAAAGTGFAIHRYLNEPAKAPGVSGIDKAVTAIHKAKKRTGDITHADHLALMTQQRHKGHFSAKQAQLAWQQAIEASDPFARKYLPSMATAIKGLPVEQVEEAIEYVIKTNQSAYAETVFSKFNKFLGALSKTPADIQFKSVEGMYEPIGLPQKLPTNLSKYLDPVLPKYSNLMAKFYSRAEKPGFGLHQVEYTSPRGVDIKFSLPTTKEGILMTGLSQQTRRIAPAIGILEKGGLTKLTREEYFMREFAETIGQDVSTGRLRNQADVNKAISALWEDVFGELQVVPNTEESLAQQRYEKVRKTEIDLRVASEETSKVGPSGYFRKEAYRRLTEEEGAEALRTLKGEDKIFAGTSPSALTKARFQTQNLAQASLFPEAVEFSRRPESGYREYGLTAEARATQTGGRFERYRSYEAAFASELEPDILSPNVRTMYVDPEVHKAALAEAKMGEGETFARRALAEGMEFEGAASVHLATPSEKVIAGDFNKLKYGETLGWDISGDIVRYDKNMRLTSRTFNDTQNRGAYATLNYMDVRRMKSNDKFFNDFKALVRLVEDSWFERAARKMGASAMFRQDVDLIASMDDLNKDPAKFAKQVMSSMGEEVVAAGGRPMDPEALATAWKQYGAIGDGKFDPRAFVREAMVTGIEEKLNPAAFGRVFGAAPYVLGVEEAERAFTQAVDIVGGTSGKPKNYLSAMMSGTAGGISKITYGGPEELLGVGKEGTIEPRMWDVFQGKGMAGISDDVTEDFLRRMKLNAPEKFAAHQELSKTLQSLEGGITRKATDPVYNIVKEGYDRAKFQKRIEGGKSFWLGLGGTLPDVFVPSADTVKAMRPYTDDIVGDLSSEFHGMAYHASRISDDVAPITQDELQKRFGAFRSAIHKQWAPGGKGSGAYMAGRLTGSKLLKMVSRAGKYEGTQLDIPNRLQVVGVPREQLREMVTGLREKGVFSKDYLDDIATKIEKTGQESLIGGVAWRHPTIDQYSIQQMMIEPIDTKAKQIVVPEVDVSVKLRKTEGLTDLKLGPLIGFAGDKDADTLAISLVSPDADKQIRQNIMRADSQFAQDYAQHQVRYQLIKAQKAGAESLTQTENMIAAARKLGTVEKYVPKLSLQMTHSKRALQAVGGSADAMMALTWLEQTPISSKHISASRAAQGELSTLMKQLTGAFENRDAKALSEVFRRITQDNQQAAAMLTGNVQLDQTEANKISRALGGTKVATTLKGVDINAVSKEIMDARNMFDSEGGRMSELMTARGGRVRKTEVSKMLEHAARSNIAKDTGVFSKVSTHAIAASNQLAAVGKGVLKHKKPIGFGFAGALAIGAFLSSPKSMVGPGSGIIPQGKITAGSNRGANKITPEALMPQRSVGSPTAPRLPPNTAMVTPPRQHSLSVRLRAGSTIDPGRFASSIASFTGGAKNVNVNMRDNRSSLDPHTVASRLL